MVITSGGTTKLSRLLTGLTACDQAFVDTSEVLSSQLSNAWNLVKDILSRFKISPLDDNPLRLSSHLETQCGATWKLIKHQTRCGCGVQ